MKLVRGDMYVRLNIVMQAQFTVYQFYPFLINARRGLYYDDDRLFSNRKLAR